MIRLSAAVIALVALVGGTGAADASRQQRGTTSGVRDGKSSDPVRAACDLAYRLSAPTGGVSIRRDSGRFQDDTLPRPVEGCRLSMKGSFRRARDAAVPDRLHTGFADSGWQELVDYSADGPDGTSFAFRHDQVACVVRGEWDGGDDSEPNDKPGDWYRVTLICARGIPSRRF
jgi:hypothetical protein